MKLLFLFIFLISILLFLVFYKSNEGFTIDSISEISRFTGAPYEFNKNINLNVSATRQEIIDDLSVNVDECSIDYDDNSYSAGVDQRMCPPNKPKCLGESHRGHWGKCHPINVLKCKYNYNQASYNNGEGSGSFMCPPGLSKCYNYSESENRLGTCIRPEKEETVNNCNSDYNSSNPLESGTCPEYIPKCVSNPNASNGICTHRDFLHTNNNSNKFPTCSMNYITNNENEHEIFLSLQQRNNYINRPERMNFHGNSVCPITNPICVGHTEGVWGECRPSGTRSTRFTHPPQGTVAEDGMPITTTSSL